jgi:cell filamentation protein
MTSYGSQGLPDPYAWPGSHVLKNKWGITDGNDLAVMELSSTRFRIDQLRERPIKGKFDLKHLQSIHRHIFQDVYEWAGELRDGTLSKGANLFAQPEHLVSYGAKVFGALKRENYLKGMNREAFLDRLAHYFGEINALHPFREGNGRALQTFLSQLSVEAGYELDFTKVDRESWNHAASRSFSESPQKIRELFDLLVIVSS